jgi:hypothetical protein
VEGALGPASCVLRAGFGVIRRSASGFVGAAFLILPPAQAQSPPIQEPPHDISQVEAAPLGGAIAVPLPEKERRKLKKYEIPELAGARQALGSQLINGALPRPLVDYAAQEAAVRQRLSIFEGGLVVVDVSGAGGTIRKKLIIPDDALKNYLRAISPAALKGVHAGELTRPRDGRAATLRVYSARHEFVERAFDPMATLPKELLDQVAPLQDLLRAVYQDRSVTNSVANYRPKAGDQLVGDDRKVYRVERVIDGHIVMLRCTSTPQLLYVDAKDLANYFIGTPRAATR